MTKEELLKRTEYVVEATHDEYYMLWEKFCIQSMFKTPLNIYKWDQVSPGYWEQIGSYYTEPINVNFWWSYINNVLVMFYEACSNVVNKQMVRDYMEQICNPTCNGQSCHTNTANFGHVLNYIKDSRR